MTQLFLFQSYVAHGTNDIRVLEKVFKTGASDVLWRSLHELGEAIRSLWRFSTLQHAKYATMLFKNELINSKVSYYCLRCKEQIIPKDQEYCYICYKEMYNLKDDYIVIKK